MRYHVRRAVLLASLGGCLGAPGARAEGHAVICASAAEAKNLVRIVDHAPKPTKIGEVLLEMRTKALKCTVVFADIQIKGVVETVRLDDDYDILQVKVNDRQYFTFKRQKGDRA